MSAEGAAFRGRGVGIGAAILMAAGVLVWALASAAPPPTAPAPAGQSPSGPEAAEAALERLLLDGPAPGLWEVTVGGTLQRWSVREDPERPDSLLLARLKEGPGPAWARPWPRAMAARMFLPGAADRFLRNYRLAEWAEGPDDTGRVPAAWFPRHDHGGATARRVWTDPATGDVVVLEDRSDLDFVVRRVARVGDAPPAEDFPSRPRGPGFGPPGGGGRPPRDASAGGRHGRSPWGPPDLERVAREAPFTVGEPAYVPPGFDLVAGGYRTWPLRVPAAEAGEEAPEPERRRVRMVWLLYGDGMASISLAFAEAEDMDAVERVARARREAQEVPGACPEIPGPSPELSGEGLVIRRRRDRCRTVLRVDGWHGVSATLLARNELPEDEYLRVMRSLVRVRPTAPVDD